MTLLGIIFQNIKFFRIIFWFEAILVEEMLDDLVQKTVILFNNNKTGELVPIELKHQKEKKENI